jgi:hypothetical protein
MATRKAKRRERVQPNLLHANICRIFHSVNRFFSLSVRFYTFYHCTNLIAAIFPELGTFSNVKLALACFTARSDNGKMTWTLFHNRFSFSAVKYREIVVNITQALINSSDVSAPNVADLSQLTVR